MWPLTWLSERVYTLWRCCEGGTCVRQRRSQLICVFNIELTAIACFWGGRLLRHGGGGSEVAEEVFRSLDQTYALKWARISSEGLHMEFK